MARSGGGTTRPRRLRVEARCAWCGVVQLETDDLEIHAGRTGHRDGDRDQRVSRGVHGGLLEFRCPACDRLNLRRLTPRDVEVLEGVGIEPVHRPAPFELMEDRSGPPITWDDLLEFHLELAVADDVATLSALGASRVPSTMANERHAA